MRTFFSYKIHMKRAKAIFFRSNAQDMDITTVSKAAVSKILVSLILANLFCAGLLYIVYLIF